jgi:hypothetical protein
MNSVPPSGLAKGGELEDAASRSDAAWQSSHGNDEGLAPCADFDRAAPALRDVVWICLGHRHPSASLDPLTN